MVITTTIDINYLNYLYCLLSSISRNSPSTFVHCRLVNIDDQEILNKIKSIHSRVIIECDSSNLSTKRKNLRARGELLYGQSIKDCLTQKYKKGVPRFLCSDLQCYTSNTRFRNFKKLFEEGYEDVIYLDADTIVRKNLEELHEHLSSDICCNISYCERYPNTRCWECSFLYIKRNHNTINFINDVIAETESDMYNWDSDQIALEKVYSSRYSDRVSLEDDIKHIEDLSALHGGELSDNSFIWAGSGSTKHTNKKFLNELTFYENLLPNK
jgi:hypothetical protein